MQMIALTSQFVDDFVLMVLLVEEVWLAVFMISRSPEIVDDFSR
jgi:hypothetical protein